MASEINKIFLFFFKRKSMKSPNGNEAVFSKQDESRLKTQADMSKKKARLSSVVKWSDEQD